MYLLIVPVKLQNTCPQHSPGCLTTWHWEGRPWYTGHLKTKHNPKLPTGKHFTNSGIGLRFNSIGNICNLWSAFTLENIEAILTDLWDRYSSNHIHLSRSLPAGVMSLCMYNQWLQIKPSKIKKLLSLIICYVHILNLNIYAIWMNKKAFEAMSWHQDIASNAFLFIHIADIQAMAIFMLFFFF